jgi:hypothetical protein
MTTDFPKKAEGVSPPTNEAAALENIPARGIRNRPVVVKPIAGLKPYDRNARTHSAEQIDQIIASISEWGWTNPVLIDEAGMILAGHGRVMAAEKMGLSEVPCITIDGLTDTQKRAYVLADNKLALNAGWDEEVLNAELKALADLQFDLGTVGFDMAEVRFLARLDATGDPEAVPEPPAEPVTKPGDVWLLGPHRLTCGDSTNAADVARVLDGAKPHLMVTDPPYGVEYDADWRNKAMPDKNDATRWKDGAGRAVGAVMNDNRADWRDAWALFPGDVAYVWHASIKTAEVLGSLEAAGFEHRAQIIWDKGQIAIGRGHYHWRHEPAWYVVRGGGIRSLAGEPQGVDGLGHPEAAEVRDGPLHAEAGRVHGAPDPQQFEAGRSGLRPVPRLRHHDNRGGAGRPRLLRSRAEPGLLRRDRRSLGSLHWAQSRTATGAG